MRRPSVRRLAPGEHAASWIAEIEELVRAGVLRADATWLGDVAPRPDASASGGPADAAATTDAGPIAPSPAGAPSLRGSGSGAVGFVTLKREGRVTVSAGRIGARPVILKAWRCATLVQRLRSAFQLSPAFRQWRGARLLSNHRIPTAAMIALLRAGGAPRFGPPTLGVRGAIDVLVMERVPGPSLLEAMAECAADARPPRTGGGSPVEARTGGASGDRSRRRLAAEVGRLVAHLLRAGLFNRDLKPSNIIVGDGGRGLVVIDPVGVRRSRAGVSAAARMLASLALEPLGVGVFPRRALVARAVWALVEHWQDSEPRAARALRRELWRRASAAVASHGDPTPRVNPLAGRGRAGSPLDQSPAKPGLTTRA